MGTSQGTAGDDREGDGAVGREVRRGSEQEAKEAQIAEWKLEVDEAHDLERAIDRIANAAPEVEDRDNLYQALLTPRRGESWRMSPSSPPC